MSETQNNTKKFSIAVRFFHWASVLMVAGVYASIWMRKLFEKGTDARMLVMNVHFALGFLLMGWLLLRMLAFFASKRPPIVPEVPSWQKKALKLMVGLQWGLMLIMPLSGWLMGNAKGRTVKVFDIPFPTLLEKNDTLAKMLGEGHEVMGKVFLALILMHTAMALWHHFFKKDNALRRML